MPSIIIMAQLDKHISITGTCPTQQKIKGTKHKRIY